MLNFAVIKKKMLKKNISKNRWANVLLVFVFILFLISIVLRRTFPENVFFEFAFYVFEAGLVGGIADWFAVTALFGKPLGISYHTNLVAKNRKRLVLAIVSSIEKELLGKKNLLLYVNKISLTAKIINFLKQKDIQEKVLKGVLAFAFKQSKGLKIEEWEKQFKDYLSQVSIGKVLQIFFGWLVKSGNEGKIYQYLLSNVEKILKKEATYNFILISLQNYKKEKEEGSFFLKVVSWFAEKTDVLNMEEMARGIQSSALKVLWKMQQEKHPIRVLWREKLECLHEKHELVLFIKVYFQELLQGISFSKIILFLKENFFKEGLLLEFKTLEKIMSRYFLLLEENKEKVEEAELYLKKLLTLFLRKEHHLLGKMVLKSLDGFTDKALIDFIKNRAGDDLQWIRINGVIVGSIVGGLLYLFLYYIYWPLFS